MYVCLSICLSVYLNLLKYLFIVKQSDFVLYDHDYRSQFKTASKLTIGVAAANTFASQEYRSEVCSVLAGVLAIFGVN